MTTTSSRGGGMALPGPNGPTVPEPTGREALLAAAVDRSCPVERLDLIADVLRRTGGAPVSAASIPTEVGLESTAGEHTLHLLFDTVHAAVAAAGAVLRLTELSEADWPEVGPAPPVRLVVLTAVGGGTADPVSGVTLSWAGRLLGQTGRGRVLATSATAVIASPTLPPGLDFVYRGMWRPAVSEDADRIYELVDLGGRTTAARSAGWAGRPSPGHSNLSWARRAVHGLAADLEPAAIAATLHATETPGTAAAPMVTILDGSRERVERCLAEVAIEVHAGGSTVLYGAWTNAASDRYGVFREAFGAYASGCDRRQLVADLEGHAPELSRLLPEVGAAVGGPHLVRPGHHPDLARLSDCLENWLRSMAARAPVVLFLDQAQWVNAACSIMISQLSQSLRSSRVRFVLADSHPPQVRSRRVDRLVEYLGPDLCATVGYPRTAPARPS